MEYFRLYFLLTSFSILIFYRLFSSGCTNATELVLWTTESIIGLCSLRRNETGNLSQFLILFLHWLIHAIIRSFFLLQEIIKIVLKWGRMSDNFRQILFWLLCTAIQFELCQRSSTKHCFVRLAENKIKDLRAFLSSYSHLATLKLGCIRSRCKSKRLWKIYCSAWWWGFFNKISLMKVIKI